MQKEPLKGNFANVARERSTGTLLGPTNHHGYQPALRALYESRFSRRMSFEDYRRNVEVVSDPALVERWKEEARTVTTIVTKEGEPPTTLNTPADARAHFRQHYFDGLVQSGTVRRVHGSVARDLPEASMMQAIRQAHDIESRYPAQFVQLLREGLQNAGAAHLQAPQTGGVRLPLASGAICRGGRCRVGKRGCHPGHHRQIAALHPQVHRRIIARQEGGRPANVRAAGEGRAGGTRGGASGGRCADRRGTGRHDGTGGGSARGGERSLPQGRRRPWLPTSGSWCKPGTFIEFHNGTFDLPLPPRPKEGPAPSNKSRAEKNGR